MANSKDNLSKYGKGFIGFDEPSGNAMDSIGGWTGTLNNAPVRVAGWNGKGYAMSFNGTNQYVQFNNTVIPIGVRSVMFKIKVSTMPSSVGVILSNSNGSTSHGDTVALNSSGQIYWVSNKNISNNTRFILTSNINIVDNKWHNVLLTWDGTVNQNGVKIYIDDMINPNVTGEANSIETTVPSNNLRVGANNLTTTTNYFNGQLDSIEIYDRVTSPIPDKYLVQHNSQYKYHDGTAWKTTTATEANFKQYGMSQLSQITEGQWQELVGAKFLAMWSDFEDKKWANAVLNIEPVTVNELLGDNPEVVYYTDSGTSHIVVETEVEPFSVYDYISELPTVVAYTEATEDIIVSTATEPFTIYDEFGDSVDVLYYTDDTAVTEADLILEANWSPVDELEGDFEVVTWTDEEDVSKTLEMTALPVPQFVYSMNIKSVKNGLYDLSATDLSQYLTDSNARFLLTPDNVNWYTWENDTFVGVTLDHTIILAEGMTAETVTSLTQSDLEKWAFPTINIGVFLKDDVRNQTVSKVSNISLDTQIYSATSKVADANFYILNTTATINIDFAGLTLIGQVDDADMTRVQYRVKLNGKPYLPSNGDFTPLSSPPLNIDLTLRSEDIIIGDWNTIEVEFQDYFGYTDSWSAQFIGKYAGLMFMDTEGKYYSTDIGQVLQYLDFGTILTGQITPSYEVKVRNEYGFDVKNAKLTVNTTNFAQGHRIQLANVSQEFANTKELVLGDLADGEETTFFIRMVSDVATIPNNNKEFNIVVMAQRVID